MAPERPEAGRRPVTGPAITPLTIRASPRWRGRLRVALHVEGLLRQGSCLPSRISLNDADRSWSETYAPGMPVNASATKIGWERNRSMRRARATVDLSSSESSSMPRMAMMS